MTRRITSLVGACLAALVVCAGCRGMADRGTSTGGNDSGGAVVVTPLPAPSHSDSSGNGGSGTESGDLGSQLDGLRTSLNQIQAQLSADAAP